MAGLVPTCFSVTVLKGYKVLQVAGFMPMHSGVTLQEDGQPSSQGQKVKLSVVMLL